MNNTHLLPHSLMGTVTRTRLLMAAFCLSLCGLGLTAGYSTLAQVANVLPVIVDNRDPESAPGDFDPGDFLSSDYVPAYKGHTAYTAAKSVVAPAEWTLPTQGDATYIVYATWGHMRGVKRTEKATYVVKVDGIVKGEKTVSQNKAPAGLNVDGWNWELIATVTVSNGQEITVELGTAGDAITLADAVMIRKTSTITVPPAEPGSCGNGVTDAGEQCDDGNPSPADGCSASCKLCPIPSCAAPLEGCTYVQDGTYTQQGCFANPCGTLRCDGMPSDMDTCLANPAYYWDQQTSSCLSQRTACTDPDNGAVTGVVGHTFGFRTQNAGPADARIRTGGKDACVNATTVREHSCTDTYFITMQNVTCEGGTTCIDGACVKTTIPPLPTCGNGVFDQGEQCDLGNPGADTPIPGRPGYICKSNCTVDVPKIFCRHNPTGNNLQCSSNFTTAECAAEKGTAYPTMQECEYALVACRNGFDDDKDGTIDMQDKGCSADSDMNEGDGAADLGLGITADLPSVAKGATITLNSTLHNYGSDNQMTPIKYGIDIPTGLTYDAANSNALCAMDNGRVYCTIPSLKVGNTSMPLRFVVGQTAPCGAISFVSRITTSPQLQNDPNASNNVATVSANVTCPNPVLLGDVNGNGQVQSNDGTLIALHLAGTQPLTAEQIARADVDMDGKITKADELLVAARNALRITLPARFGDVNGNGQVQSNDGTLLAQHVAGTITLSGNALFLADTDMDGDLDQTDVDNIAKANALLITLPVLTQNPAILLGDANKDGAITTGDPTRILQMAATDVVPTADDLARADINKNGRITKADAYLVLGCLSGQLADEYGKCQFPAVFGDVTNDGKVTSLDVSRTRQEIMRISKGEDRSWFASLTNMFAQAPNAFTPRQQFLADVNRDDVINLLDVADMEGAVTGIHFELPVETTATTCTDTDGGKDASVKGTTRYTAPGIDDIDDDTCVDSSRLAEQFCVSATEKSEEMTTCEFGCENGACKKAPVVVTQCSAPTGNGSPHQYQPLSVDVDQNGSVEARDARLTIAAYRKYASDGTIPTSVMDNAVEPAVSVNVKPDVDGDGTVDVQDILFVISYLRCAQPRVSLTSVNFSCASANFVTTATVAYQAKNTNPLTLMLEEGSWLYSGQDLTSSKQSAGVTTFNNVRIPAGAKVKLCDSVNKTLCSNVVVSAGTACQHEFSAGGSINIVTENGIEVAKVQGVTWNFPTCLHVFKPDNKSVLLHKQNHFCNNTIGSFSVPLKATTSNPSGGIDIKEGDTVELCHGNNSGICGAPVKVTKGGTTGPTVCEGGFTCTKQPVGNACQNLVVDCFNGKLEISGSCGTASCTGQCVKCVPNQPTSAPLTIAMKSIGTTGTAARNQKDVTLLRFEARADGEEALITETVFRAAAGSLANAQNYRLWTDSNKDGVFDDYSMPGTVQGNLLRFGMQAPTGPGLNPGELKVVELRADIASSPLSNQLQLEFATTVPEYIETDPPLSGIKTNGTCAIANCQIIVTTVPSKLYTLVNQGELFVTLDTTLVRPRQLLAGAVSDYVMRVDLRAQNENLKVTTLRFVTVGGPAASIERLHLFKSDGTAVAVATPAGCGSFSVSTYQGSPSRTFCAMLGNNLTIPDGQSVDILVKALLKSDVSGAVSNEPIQLAIDTSGGGGGGGGAMGGLQGQVAQVQTFGFVEARGETSNTELGHGSIHIGTSTSGGQESPVVSPKHVSVLSKIVTIANANPDPDGTSVPTGVSPIGQFRFTAATNANTLNGLNKVAIQSMILRVTSTNVQYDNSSFKLYDKADSTVKIPCTLLNTAASGNPVVTNAYVRCNPTSATPLDLSIASGESRTFVLETSVTNPQVTASAASSLRVSLENFADPASGAGYIPWKDTDASANAPTFQWFEYADTVVNGTSYSRTAGSTTSPLADNATCNTMPGYSIRNVGNVIAGTQFQATMVMDNPGPSTWVVGAATPYNLSILPETNWGLAAATHNSVIGQPAETQVKPGQVFSFDFYPLVAPSTPGTYPIKIQMKKNGVAFGSVCTHNIVVKAATTTTTNPLVGDNCPDVKTAKAQMPLFGTAGKFRQTSDGKYLVWAALEGGSSRYVKGVNYDTCETTLFGTTESIRNGIDEISVSDNGKILYKERTVVDNGTGIVSKLYLVDKATNTKTLVTDKAPSNGTGDRALISRDGKSIVVTAWGANMDNDPSTTFSNADGSRELFVIRGKGAITGYDVITQITNFVGGTDQYTNMNDAIFEDAAGRFITVNLDWNPVTGKRHERDVLTTAAQPSDITIWQSRLYLYDTQTKTFHKISDSASVSNRASFQSLINAKIASITGSSASTGGFFQSFFARLAGGVLDMADLAGSLLR